MDSLAIEGRSRPGAWIAQLVKWQTTDFTVLLSTSGIVTDWNGDRYLPRHVDYGMLGELPDFEDGVGAQTDRIDLTLFPETDYALAAICDRKHQKTKVHIWDVTFDGETGLLMGLPDLLLAGEVDFARIVNGADRREVVIEVVTEQERLMEPNEDRRLSHSHHQSVWPGELGLVHVTGIGRKIYWRSSQPSSGGQGSGGGYSGGGGGGGGGMNEARL